MAVLSSERPTNITGSNCLYQALQFLSIKVKVVVSPHIAQD